jgi:hypothetical protein
LKGNFGWVAFVALVVMLTSACGGGGGGTSDGSTNATGTTSTTAGSTGTIINDKIAAVQRSNSNSAVDPANVLVGDSLQLFVSGRNTNNQFVLVSGSNWSTNAPRSVATVSADGVLTANGSSNGTVWKLYGQGPNGSLSTNFVVVSTSHVVTGLVRNVNSTPIPGVILTFFDASKNQVAESVTGLNGTFRAGVPSSATRFTIDISNADPFYKGNTIYYRQFGYGDNDYLENDVSCLSRLPALTNGAVALPYDIVLDDRASGPPPPPIGCVGP